MVRGGVGRRAPTRSAKRHVVHFRCFFSVSLLSLMLNICVYVCYLAGKVVSGVVVGGGVVVDVIQGLSGLGLGFFSVVCIRICGCGCGSADLRDSGRGLSGRI